MFSLFTRRYHITRTLTSFRAISATYKICDRSRGFRIYSNSSDSYLSGDSSPNKLFPTELENMPVSFFSVQFFAKRERCQALRLFANCLTWSRCSFFWVDLKWSVTCVQFVVIKNTASSLEECCEKSSSDVVNFNVL